MSAILNPIGTLVIAGGKLATSFGGVTAILSRLLPFFLRLAGPVGAVIALFQIFGRDIANGVQRWADAIREAVGPQVQQLFAAMTDLVDGLRESFRLLADSEIGQFFAEVRDWIGALIGDFLEMWGVINGVVLSGIVQAVTGIVRVIGDGIDAVNSILKNGWEAGWEGAVQAVGRAIMALPCPVETTRSPRKTRHGVTGVLAVADRPAPLPRNSPSGANCWSWITTSRWPASVATKTGSARWSGGATCSAPSNSTRMPDFRPMRLA